ncbi:MAG: PD40 domain-containing protein [Actinobacteria bacterium]|nr:PD40 domain-containing protein [Actinomycetota bacterium]
MISRRQALIAGILAVLVLAAAIALLVARGHDHRPAHRLLAGDSPSSTSSPPAASTTTTSPPVPTTTARPAVTAAPKRVAPAPSSTYAGPRGGIAFVDGNQSPGQGGISVMDPDGSHIRHIADFEFGRTASRPDSPWFGGDAFNGLAWNRAGDLIAAGRDGKYGGGLEVMAPDGSGRHTLVHDSAIEHPSFSPDGRSIVFYEAGAHLATSGAGSQVVISIDGRSQRNLGDAAPPGDPAWSPDGAVIAITGDHVTLVRADNGKLVRSIAIPPNTAASSPAWSPDGRWISFTATTVGSTPDYTTDVYKVHPDGTGLRRVTDNHDLSGSASWSPDGSRMVFVRPSQAGDGSSTSQLWTMAADGSDQRQLTTLADGAGQPAWG